MKAKYKVILMFVFFQMILVMILLHYYRNGE